MSNETLRSELTKEGFDWETGAIIWHDTNGRSGWASEWDVRSRQIIDKDSTILDTPYDTGYGRPECPNFIAFDNDKIYFPTQYDGSTRLISIWKDPIKYLEDGTMTPFPGN
jgi:hypothetical protein